MANSHREHHSFTLTIETDVYADGDLLADVAEIPRVVPPGHGPALITDLTVVDAGDQAAAFDLYFTTNSSSWGTVNAAVSISDAIAADITGKISVASGDYDDFTNNQVAFKDGLSVPIERGNSTGGIYVAAVSRGTGNYSATTDLVLEISVELR